MTWSAAVLNVAIDFTICLLPLPELWKLNMSRRKKSGILLMFSVGLLYNHYPFTSLSKGLLKAHAASHLSQPSVSELLSHLLRLPTLPTTWYPRVSGPLSKWMLASSAPACLVFEHFSNTSFPWPWDLLGIGHHAVMIKICGTLNAGAVAFRDCPARRDSQRLARVTSPLTWKISRRGVMAELPAT